MVSHKTLQDNLLFQLTKSGDQAAYKEIYERYFDVLFIHAYKRLQDKEEAQDLVQEIFTILWDKRLAITLTGTLTGYLYTSVRNKIINIISHKKVASTYIQSFQHFIGQGTCQTDYLARERQLVALIDKEVAALPAKMQEVFSLRFSSFLFHNVSKEQSVTVPPAE